MAIEAIEGKGVNRVNVICDECGTIETVTCDYIRKSSVKSEPNEGQAKRKVLAHGWAEVKGNLYCRSCEAKRKVVNMSEAKEKKVDAMVREPSRAQRKEINEAIALVYDTERGRYTGAYTDRVVAEEIGNGVMPGWVAEIRDMFYGPAGGNEETVALLDQISKFAEQADKVLQTAKAEMQSEVARAVQKYEQTFEKKMAEVSAFKARVERLEKASDMRVRG